jgi:hypothetical protein
MLFNNIVSDTIHSDTIHFLGTQMVSLMFFGKPGVTKTPIASTKRFLDGSFQKPFLAASIKKLFSSVYNDETMDPHLYNDVTMAISLHDELHKQTSSDHTPVPRSSQKSEGPPGQQECV